MHPKQPVSDNRPIGSRWLTSLTLNPWRTVAMGGAALLVPALSSDLLSPPHISAARGGLFYGSLVLAVTLLALQLAPATAGQGQRRVPPLLWWSCLAFIGASGASVYHAIHPLLAGVAAIRNALVCLTLLIWLHHAHRNPRLHQALAAPLAWGTAAVIVFLALAYGASTLSDAVRLTVFESGSHQHVGQLDRFRGSLGAPGSLGFHLLAFIALLEALPEPRWRRPLQGLAGLFCLLSFSFASLVLPMVAIIWLLPKGTLRRVFAGAAAAVALLILLTAPLSLSLGQRHMELGTLHPNYGVDGNGPRLTPVREIRLGPVSLKVHASHYAQVVSGGLSCVQEHPWFGVGGLNFAAGCRVLTMDSYGSWARRRAHNQMVGIVAEHGVLGLLAFLGLALLLWRHYGPMSATRLEHALFAGYILCTMQGEILLQPIFALWLGQTLGRQRAAGGPPCHSCATPTTISAVDWLHTCGQCGHWSTVDHHSSGPVTPLAEGSTEVVHIPSLSRVTTDLRRANANIALQCMAACGPPPGHGAVAVSGAAGRRLLDIGSGDGLFAATAIAEGWAVLAIEPDAELARLGQERPECITTQVSFFDDQCTAALATSPGFDAVVFNHSIEHFSDPAGALRNCGGLLAPSGILVLHGPRAEGIVHRLALLLTTLLGADGPLKRMWWRHFPAPLFHRFSVAGLRTLVEAHGFMEVGHATTAALDMPGLAARLDADRTLKPWRRRLWVSLAWLVWPLVRWGTPDYHVQIFRHDPPVP